MHGHDVRRHADARDWCDIAQLIVRHLREQRHGDRVRRDIALKERVAVWRRFGDVCGTDDAGSADAVVDDDLLAPQPGETVGEQTCLPRAGVWSFSPAGYTTAVGHEGPFVRTAFA